MLKLTLSPLDSKVANALAERRKVTVYTLVSSLLREEAAIEFANFRDLPVDVTGRAGQQMQEPAEVQNGNPG